MITMSKGKFSFEHALSSSGSRPFWEPPSPTNTTASLLSSFPFEDWPLIRFLSSSHSSSLKSTDASAVGWFAYLIHSQHSNFAIFICLKRTCMTSWMSCYLLSAESTPTDTQNTCIYYPLPFLRKCTIIAPVNVATPIILHINPHML